MTKVDVAFAKEELPFDIAGEEAEVPDLSQYVDRDNSECENFCETKTSNISGFDNSSGPIKFSKLKDNRWKPYNAIEKQRLEEQNIRRSILIQKEILRCGLNFSPFYEPHIDDQRSDINFETSIATRHRQISCSSEEFSSSPDDEDESHRVDLHDSDFSVYLHKSDLELVKEFMDAEDKVEEMQKAVQAARLDNQLTQRTREFDLESELEKIRVFRKEIDKLTQENLCLSSKNLELRSCLGIAD